MKQLRVIVVDDEADGIATLSKMLRLNCPEVEIIATCNNAETATQQIQALQPDVVFLDIQMPGKSGIDILNYIKKENKDCRVIMITNHAFDSYRKKCIELGAEHFLDKSADFEKISGILGDMLESSN